MTPVMMAQLAAQAGSFVAAHATAISTAASLASGAIGAAGTIAAGNAAVSAAKAEQKQLDQMAAEERAVASRNAAAADLKTRQLLSRGQAVAAASGGGATDPTVLELMGNLAAEGSVQSREAMRQGIEQGKSLEYKGAVGVSTAKTNRNLGYLTAGGQLISGVGDAFAKYGQGLPKTGSKIPSATAIPTADYNWWQEPGYRYPTL